MTLDLEYNGKNMMVVMVEKINNVKMNIELLFRVVKMHSKIFIDVVIHELLSQTQNLHLNVKYMFLGSGLCKLYKNGNS